MKALQMLSKKRENKVEANSIQSKPKRTGRLVSSFKWPAVIFIVVLVCFVAGYAYSLWHDRSSDEVNTEVETAYVKVLDESEALVAQKKYNEAVSKWEEYIKNSQDKEYKTSAYINLSTIYFNSGQYQKAKESAYKAREEIGKDTRAVCLAIAYAAAETGDYQEAIDNYKKVLTFNEQDINKKGQDFGVKFQLESDRDNYELIIKDLESKL